MKRFRYFFLALAALSFAAVSCQTQEEPFEPGEPEESGCYGVYFPVQDATGPHTYDPTMPTVIYFTAARTNASGAIDVPLTVSDPNGVFQVGPLHFNDGQTETQIEVNFPSADSGIEYPLSLTIEDNKYASKYSSNPISIDFSVMRVEMKSFMTPDGSKPAMITFTDADFWEEVHDDCYISYYEVDGVRYCETTGGKLVSGGSEGVGPWGTDVQLKFKWYTKKTVTVNDVDYQWIEVEPQYHGWDSSNGPVYFGDFYHMRADMGLSNGDFTSSYDRYVNGTDGYLPSYYDGNGGFVFNMAYWIHGTTSWYGYQNNAPLGIAEGFTRVDYSLDMELDYVQDGVLPVYLETGVDVASVSLAGYEGELTATQVANKVADISSGKEDSAISVSTADFELDEEEGKLVGATGLSFENTGVYTVVAVAFDAEGNAQESASAVHSYVSGNDSAEFAVKVKVGAEATPSRFEGEEYDGKTSFAFYVLGEDITEAHVGIFDAAKYNAAVDTYRAAVKTDEDGDFALDADAIVAVNAAGGYYDVVTGAAPNTEYVVLVWATNGSEEAFATATYKTDGLPNEIVNEDGCFVYTIFFTNEDESPYFDPLPLEFNPNTGEYEIKNWGYGATFRFTYDEETGKISVPQQFTGYTHPSYGRVFVGDSSMLPQSWIDYFEIDVEPQSFVDEDGNFHFYLSYILEAGAYAGTDYEFYLLDSNSDIPGEESGDEPGDDSGDDSGEGAGDDSGEGAGDDSGEGAGTSSVRFNVKPVKTLQPVSYTGKNHERDIKAVTVKTSYVAPKHHARSSMGKTVLNMKLMDIRR